MTKIVREKILSRKSELFVEVLTILQQDISKGSERRKEKLVRLVIWTTDRRNAHLSNVSYADMKIT